MRLTVHVVSMLVVMAVFATSCGTGPAAIADPSMVGEATGSPRADHAAPTATASPSQAAPDSKAIPLPLATVAPLADSTPAPIPAFTPEPTPESVAAATVVRTGAGVLVASNFEQLRGRRVGLIAHRASVVDGVHLATLLDQAPEVTLAALFAPEHGLFGLADAGESVADTVDPATGVPVFSLYGRDREPSQSALAELDVLVYDLQDVGARFFTYTSTLGLAMSAAAKANISFVVLDRPNPLGGSTLQGPTLSAGLESFIGMYPVPSAYGLTSGELARLIKNESLLPGLDDLDLQVISMMHWARDMRWHSTGLEWIAPSPNLPTADSALLYPGTVLFEATTISEGRGTDEPFQLIGADWLDGDALAATMTALELPGVWFEPTTFTPRSLAAAPNPRFEGQLLTGVHIVVSDADVVSGVEVGLYLLDAILRQAESAGRDAQSIIDRGDVFDRLAGSPAVRSHLAADEPVADVIESFESDHLAFLEFTTDSLLYPRKTN